MRPRCDLWSSVDLGQERQMVVASASPSSQSRIALDLGLDHEAARPGSLDQIADGVEADDLDAGRGKAGEEALDELAELAGARIEVDLLGGSVLPKVVQTRVGVGGSPTSKVDQGRARRRKICSRSPATGSAVGPDLVQSDEQIGPLRIAAL